MASILFSDVIEASKRLEGVVMRTPVVNSQVIDEMAGRRVFMKCENLQHVGAFKFRGATNAVKILGEEAESGLCTHSSGNHGQAVALAAKQRGVPAYIVMPNTAPKVKINGVRSHGAEVVLCEPNLEARVTTANSVLDRTGAAFIHPFDNLNVIAGQGTAAKEMIEECEELDAVLSPIGGGGLMSGTCISTRALLPDALLFGAEPDGADDAARSLELGEFQPQISPETICDGLLTSMGELTWPIIKSHVEEIVRVSDEEVLIAMTMIHEIFGMAVEPSGAISLAAVLKDEFRSKEGIGSIGIILSGGNVDPEIFPSNP
ncbi:MAG TPA: pyridoxal-phosphate dependent enzyme [Candidatus Thalassarchaeaceae archaeon]|jgi:threonine dehydratase|nr:pyridoxal-phosphate dependent enzyme [Candidatus Thalassarchaeaceae archaeon]